MRTVPVTAMDAACALNQHPDLGAGDGGVGGAGGGRRVARSTRADVAALPPPPRPVQFHPQWLSRGVTACQHWVSAQCYGTQTRARSRSSWGQDTVRSSDSAVAFGTPGTQSSPRPARQCAAPRRCRGQASAQMTVLYTTAWRSALAVRLSPEGGWHRSATMGDGRVRVGAAAYLPSAGWRSHTWSGLLASHRSTVTPA